MAQNETQPGHLDLSGATPEQLRAANEQLATFLPQLNEATVRINERLESPLMTGNTVIFLRRVAATAKLSKLVARLSVVGQQFEGQVQEALHPLLIQEALRHEEMLAQADEQVSIIEQYGDGIPAQTQQLVRQALADLRNRPANDPLLKKGQDLLAEQRAKEQADALATPRRGRGAAKATERVLQLSYERIDLLSKVLEQMTKPQSGVQVSKVDFAEQIIATSPRVDLTANLSTDPTKRLYWAMSQVIDRPKGRGVLINLLNRLSQGNATDTDRRFMEDIRNALGANGFTVNDRDAVKYFEDEVLKKWLKLPDRPVNVPPINPPHGVHRELTGSQSVHANKRAELFSRILDEVGASQRGNVPSLRVTKDEFLSVMGDTSYATSSGNVVDDLQAAIRRTKAPNDRSTIPSMASRYERGFTQLPENKAQKDFMEALIAYVQQQTGQSNITADTAQRYFRTTIFDKWLQLKEAEEVTQVEQEVDREVLNAKILFEQMTGRKI